MFSKFDEALKHSVPLFKKGFSTSPSSRRKTLYAVHYTYLYALDVVHCPSMFQAILIRSACCPFYALYCFRSIMCSNS